MQIQPFDIVIYHQGCYDGFGSAWVARQHSPDAVFIAAQHGDPPPDVTGKRVLICDFSYPRAVLTELWRSSAFLMMLDHHKSAREDLYGQAIVRSADGRVECLGLGWYEYCPGLFINLDMGRSGASLTWDTLMPRRPRPRLVDHIEDRDLWRFWLPGTREVHAALSTLPFDFGQWTQFADELEDDPESIQAEGEAVLRYVANTCTKLASRARRIVLTGAGGHVEVWAVNAPPELLSETAEILKSREPALPIFAWSWDGERGSFYCSLRSAEGGVDVSEIATRFGGGGHKHAAGFRCAYLELMDPDHGVIEVHS